MRKPLLSLIVGLGVLLATLTCEPAAYGQRRGSGGGSSGRSYSSGSSSYSRPSGSGRTSSSPSKPSLPSKVSSPPSRPTTSGKSYSSGAHSAPASPPSRKPSNPPPATAQKRTPPPPSQDFPARTKPSSTGFDAGGAAAQRKAQSRAAYTNKSTNPDSPPDSASSPQVVHPSGKTYAKNGYDAAGAQAQRREESRIAYEAGKAPKPSYRTPAGIEKPIEANAPEVQRVRKVVTPDIWRTRPRRIDYVYRPYYGFPVVVYNDPYNSFFWYWLLSQSLDTRSAWMYHHRRVMDQARYDALLKHDAELPARVARLEQNNVPRDTSYVPPGIDPDLMYADDFVESAFNPQEVETTGGGSFEPGVDFPTTSPRGNPQLVRVWRIIWRGLFAIAATAAITFFLIWLVFIKRWGGDCNAPNRAKRHGRR